VDDALFRVETREAFARLSAQGWVDALRALHPEEQIYTFWTISATPMGATPVCASITYCSTRRRPVGLRARLSTETYAVGRRRAIRATWVNCATPPRSGAAPILGRLRCRGS